MRKTTRAAMTAGAALGALALLVSPAYAHAYDHKDPYATNCDEGASKRLTVPIKNSGGEQLGTLYLYWSAKCKTNWVQIKVSSRATGVIRIWTEDGRSDSFTYKAGNNGWHWGNMLWAPGICVWGTATANQGSGSANQGKGATGRSACD
ncbi:DUF2690 domain-containing protein [Nonomuraea sp. NN258]|uniref:DUF2690 domain-containing protein n=1 Tax=Nonomuraea antri TaxID=2730852 RepID=UPI0015694D28|nr:DUF2690 domain-containing protein [Nonomuraea antri]NRQ33706.1 DUF2690 domain-containing protein [Nonomuraea antri]